MVRSPLPENPTLQPEYVLSLTFHTSGIERLFIRNPLSYGFALKLKCGRCEHVSENWIYIVSKKLYDKPHSRGKVNYYGDCSKCHFQGFSVNVDVKSVGEYNGHHPYRAQPIATFDCRGDVVPVDFLPRGGWVAVSEQGTEHANIDLTKPWEGYDSGLDEPVEVKLIRAEFKRKGSG